MRFLGFSLTLFAAFLIYKAGHFAGSMEVRRNMFVRCVEAKIPTQTCLQYIKDL